MKIKVSEQLLKEVDKLVYKKKIIKIISSL